MLTDVFVLFTVCARACLCVLVVDFLVSGCNSQEFYWMSPMSWGIRSAAINEFGSPEYDYLVELEDGGTGRAGDYYLDVSAGFFALAGATGMFVELCRAFYCLLVAFVFIGSTLCCVLIMVWGPLCA
jgi:hypothetical protein